MRIKETNERHTQPGTVCLVYLHDDELLGYIPFIETMLSLRQISAITYLQLEDLQGVTGLKAVRIIV